MKDSRKPQKYDPRRLSVLVLDDSNFICTLMREILHALGIHMVKTAGTARQAFEQMMINHYDIIFTDWHMEPIDGLTFTRQIRQFDIPHLKRVKIIMVTAAKCKEDILAARDAGVDEFVMKPVSPTSLLMRMKAVIETPRPFIDGSVYVGPCRRRKNSADYYGNKRRLDDTPAETLPFETNLTKEHRTLAEAVENLHAIYKNTNFDQIDQVKCMQNAVLNTIHEADKVCDIPMKRALKTLAGYIDDISVLDKIQPHVIDTGVSVVNQLIALPQSFGKARESVVDSLNHAIEKKLAVARVETTQKENAHIITESSIETVQS